MQTDNVAASATLKDSLLEVLAVENSKRSNILIEDSQLPLDGCDTLLRALEQVYKTTSRSWRYRVRCFYPGANLALTRNVLQGFRPASSREGFADTADDLVLLEGLANSLTGQDTQSILHSSEWPDLEGQAGLWLDDDTDTVWGGQEDDTYTDVSHSIDMWLSDEAESPLGDSDDVWDSSQATMLDVRPLLFAHLRAADA